MIFIFQRVARSTPLLICAALVEVYAVAKMNEKGAYLMETFGGENPPDLWFGVPAQKLHDYLAGIGADGREAYLDTNTWDLMPYMPAYMVLGGSLLYLQCETAGISVRISLVFAFVMLCDAVETLGFRYVTQTFPTPLKAHYIDVISLANILKWSTLVVGFVLLAALFVKNSMASRKARTLARTEKTK